MNQKMRYAALGFAAAFVLLGCASMSKKAGFSEVRQQVDERIGFRVHWYGDTALDDETAEGIKALLDKPLTADVAVQIALLNNHRLQATYETLGIARAAVVDAGSLSNPALHGSATFGLSEDGMAVPADAHRTYTFELKMDFLSILYAPMQKSVAEADFETAKLRLTAAVMDLARQTRIAFYRVQAGKQVLEMFHQIVLATQAGYEFAHQLHQAGNIPELDLFLQRALYEQSKLALAAEKGALAESREQLNRLMGLWGEETAWTVESRLPNIPTEPMKLDNVEKIAIENSIALALAREGIVSIGKQLGVVKAMSLVPSFDIGGEVEREGGELKAGPALGFEIPLFDRNQGERAAAAAELRRRQSQYYALAVEVRSAVRAARHRLLTARQIALFYQNEMLPLQEKILEQVQLQYNAMQVGTLQLLLAKQHEIDAGRDYIRALYNYHVARAELEQILNGRMALNTPVGASLGQGNGSVKSLDGVGAEGGH